MILWDITNCILIGLGGLIVLSFLICIIVAIFKREAFFTDERIEKKVDDIRNVVCCAFDVLMEQTEEGQCFRMKHPDFFDTESYEDGDKYKFIYVTISYWLSKYDEINGEEPKSVTYLGKRYLDMLYVVSKALEDFTKKYGSTCEFAFESVVSGYFDFTKEEIDEAVKIIDSPEFMGNSDET